jgi:hypothetical protein
MDLQKIKEKVESISKNKNIHEQEIYSAIDSFLESNYNYEVPSDEVIPIIEEIKKKILVKLYRSDRHRIGVNRATKYDQLFNLDGIEMKYLDRAFTELESDGQVSSVMYEISLTEKGIMTVRNASW